MEEKLYVMVDSIGKVEKTAKGEKTVDRSASNEIDHLKRRTEKVENKRGREITQSLSNDDNEMVNGYPKFKVLTSSASERGSLLPLNSKLGFLVLAEGWPK